MKKYVFGVDIGGTTVKIGFFSADGTLLEKWEIPTRTENGGEQVLPDVAASVKEAMNRHDVAAEQVEGIGIAVPGPVDAENTVYKCVNLGWGVFNVKERMNELLSEIPHVAAGNDANVAALGELWQGGGQGCRSAVMITLGTGVGGGVVLDGQIVAGRNGGAGEIGHMTVNPEETVACTCGKYGCLEQYASARGIVHMAKGMLADCDTPSALRDIADFTSKEICELAAAGDAMAVAIMERTDGLVAVCSGSDSEGYKYCLGQNGGDLRAFTREWNGALGGRGGGNHGAHRRPRGSLFRQRLRRIQVLPGAE